VRNHRHTTTNSYTLEDCELVGEFKYESARP
jgi:hypothetical protein